MNVELLKSKAFQRAALKSEFYRISGLLCLLAVFLLYSLIQFISAGHIRLLGAQLFLIALTFGYEFFMLRIVKAALEAERSIAAPVWVLNVIIEAQIPTLALFILIRNQIMGPYQVLVAPAILLYFLLIILSTLRLSPMLSALTGVAGAAGYLVIAFYVMAVYPPETGPASVPLIVYFAYASSILVSGGVAAFVAGQIRGHVSAALREAQLQSELDQVNHDLDVARSIQQALLPTRPPILDDFDIAGWNKPADQTGGDYFDWQEMPNGEFAVSLADATGHGIGPALISSSCRAYTRASLLTNGHRDGVLNRLNGLLAADLPSNRFVTFAIIFLDPKTSKVKVLSAGHGPMLWYQYANDSVRNLEAQGIPLGMMAGFKYENGTDGTLETGDVLAVVTDGFSEWENPEGEDFGVARLEAVLRETRGQSAEEIITRLRNAVEEFCRGTKQLDDLTVVIIRRKNQ